MRQNDIQTENERERCGLGKQLKEAEHKPSNCVGSTEPAGRTVLLQTAGL